MPTTARASLANDGRIPAAARWFRAMLAADTEIEQKVDGDGALRILVVHAGDTDAAKLLIDKVAVRDAGNAIEPIRGRPVHLEAARVDEALGAQKAPIAGMIVAEPLGKDQIQRLIRTTAERRVILYSPFEGDVERGVSGGLSIQAQVRPFINSQSLRAGQIVLRESFLKVAKVYP